MSNKDWRPYLPYDIDDIAIWNGKPYKSCVEDNTGNIPPINRYWIEVEFTDNPYLDEVLR